MTVFTENDDLCPLCGGKKLLGKTTFTADTGETVIVVKNVPATLCGMCGNEWFSRETMKVLEQITQEAKQRHQEIELMQFPKSA